MDIEIILELVGAALAVIVGTAIALTLFIRWGKRDRPSSFR